MKEKSPQKNLTELRKRRGGESRAENVGRTIGFEEKICRFPESEAVFLPPKRLSPENKALSARVSALLALDCARSISIFISGFFIPERG